MKNAGIQNKIIHQYLAGSRIISLGKIPNTAITATPTNPERYLTVGL